MLDPRTADQLEALMRHTASEAAQDGAMIYHIVAWDVKQTVIPLTRLRELLDQAGLQELSLPPIRESSALLRALREMVEDRRIEVTFNDESETDYTFIRTVRGTRESRRAIHLQEEVVTYRKVAKANEERVVYSSNAAQTTIEPWLKLYLESYTARDIIEKVLQPAVRRLGGFSMRGQGGMYCVPPTGAETLEKLHTFLGLVSQETGHGAHLTDLQVADSAKTREDMRYHSHNAILAMMAETRASLKDMLRKDRAGKIKPETVAGYLAEVDDLGQRARLYRNLAQLDIHKLDAALAEMRAAFTAVRNGLSVEEFDVTLAGVDAAIQRAEEAGVSVNDLTAIEAAGKEVDPFTHTAQPVAQPVAQKDQSTQPPVAPVADGDDDPFKK